MKSGDANTPAGAGQSAGKPAPAVTVLGASMRERKSALARYAVMQVNHALEAMNFAVGFKLDERMAISSETEALAYGCRMVRKLSPAYEREFDTAVEELDVAYVKCLSETVPQSSVSSAVLEGRDRFTIVYDKPYPRLGFPDFVLSYPTYVGLRGGPRHVELIGSTGSVGSVERTVQMSANRTQDSELETSFQLEGKSTDRFTLHGAGGVTRESEIIVQFSGVKGVKFKIRKDGSRKVVSLSVDMITVSAKNSDGQSPGARPSQVELILNGDGNLQMPSRNCASVSGSFAIWQEGHASGVLKVSETEASVGDEKPHSVRLCEQDEDQFFLDELESVFL